MHSYIHTHKWTDISRFKKFPLGPSGLEVYYAASNSTTNSYPAYEYVNLFIHIYIYEQRSQPNFGSALRTSTSAAPQLTPQITVIMLTYNYLSKHVTPKNVGSALRASTSATQHLTPQVTYNYISKHVTLNNFGSALPASTWATQHLTSQITRNQSCYL